MTATMSDYRAQAERDMDIPDRPRCRTCRDSGEVRAERWGERDCTDPTDPCPDCTAGGW